MVVVGGEWCGRVWSGCAGGQSNWEIVRGTNVDTVMLVKVVDERGGLGLIARRAFWTK